MARIKFKSPSPKDPDRLNLLLEILSRNDIYATKLFPIADGFIATTETDTEIDKIFNGTIDKELQEKQFTPLIPPELKAHRSVLVFKIEDHIYENSEENILYELQEKNPWISGITNVAKFSRGRGLKITFAETITAKKAQEKGLLLFSMRIPSYNIIQDKYHNINTCLKCYALEEHHTSKCPRSKDFKICSECSVSGHTWRECEGGPKRCINCDGNHSTMAMACGKKKTIINNKRKAEREGTASYSEATKKTMSASATTQVKIPSFDTHITIIQCMYHAHVENTTNPGSYEKAVNEFFKANNLPTLKVPIVPQSSLFLAKLTEEMERNIKRSDQPEEAQQTEQPPQQAPQDKQHSQYHDGSATETETEKQTSGAGSGAVRCKKQEKKRKTMTKITGTDIGLKVHTPRSKGWVETPLRKQALIQGIEDKSIKWTYTDPSIKEKEIMEKLVFGMVDITGCLCPIDDDLFRKTKNGLLEERSPPPRPEKQRKKSI